MTQHQGPAEQQHACSYGELSAEQEENIVTHPSGGNTQQWGFNHGIEYGGCPEQDHYAQQQVFAAPIDSRQMEPSIFVSIRSTHRQRGIDPWAQVNAAHTSTFTALQSPWQNPAFMPAQLLPPQHHLQVHTNLSNQTQYMYPSQLLGHPGAVLSQHANFTAPRQGITIPELQRTPTGSTNVEPNVVFDETGRSYQAYREGKYFSPNDGVQLTNEIRNSFMS